MIFQNIDFHNVEEMEAGPKGYTMWRLPRNVREQVNEGIRDLAGSCSTGIEIRFKIRGDFADIFLRSDQDAEAQAAYIYYGSFQGGWQYSSKIISSETTRIRIGRPENLDLLKEITREKNLPFDPEVVRVVLPYGHCYFLGAEGDIEPPAPRDVPSRTYLAYGSSITHGSLALAAPYTYPFRIAQKMGYDYINLGFAGSAQMEKEMAEYIVSRKDWNFASVEMGINMLREPFSLDLFEERIDAFTKVLAADSRPVFATSIFAFNAPFQEKAAQYRKIVKKYAEERLIFTDGLTLLDNPAFVSQDLYHPTLEGMDQILHNWYNVMDKTLHSGK